MECSLLYVASTYSHIRNFHLPYLQEFARLGWTVDVACGGQPMDIPEASHTIHVPFHKNISLLKNRKALHQLRALLSDGRYTLVSTHTSLASFFVRLAALGLRHRPPIACMVHGYLFDEQTPAAKRLLLAGAESLTAPVTDLLLTMNRWDYAYAQQHHLGKRIANVPGIGLPFQRLTGPDAGLRSTLRQAYHLTDDRFLLIYAAEFSPRKSQETLIRAMTELPERVVLCLPGEGALRQSCQALVKQLELSHRVILPGQVSNMASWYAAADAAVSSSRSEGLPFNIMEAMYYGLPVVCTRVKGHADLIEDGVSGLLFPYGSSRDCAAQLRRLIDDPMLCQRLGAHAGASVRPYGLTDVLPQVMEQYCTLLPIYPVSSHRILSVPRSH